MEVLGDSGLAPSGVTNRYTYKNSRPDVTWLVGYGCDGLADISECLFLIKLG